MRYKYVTIPLTYVLGVTGHEKPPDSYLSDDEETRAVQAVLNEGFRWIRTDGDFAVFEKQNY